MLLDSRCITQVPCSMQLPMHELAKTPGNEGKPPFSCPAMYTSILSEVHAYMSEYGS